MGRRRLKTKPGRPRGYAKTGGTPKGGTWNVKTVADHVWGAIPLCGWATRAEIATLARYKAKVNTVKAYLTDWLKTSRYLARRRNGEGLSVYRRRKGAPRPPAVHPR